MDKQKLKQKIKQVLASKKRKNVEGKVNIENVSAPKKHKPKKTEEHKVESHKPGMVSVGQHGGRYVQEPSGHKRYVKEGQLSGVKRYKKSIKDLVEEVLKKSQVEDFVKSFRERKK